MTEKKMDKFLAMQQTSGTPAKGEDLDAFTNGTSKKNKPKKIIPSLRPSKL
jgi:hypothetical protein